ncbi:MAG: AMP-binding protein [Deltaproteobacteria bacterium]|nr:AMP-binding protein [Deltaproteobacteria bacterium]
MIEARNLWQLIERRAAHTPDALLAVDEEDRRLSFAEYKVAAERCAAGLSELGVGEGTPVSWMLPTWLESLVLVGGLTRLAARQNPVLPIYRQREASFITRQSGARLLIVPSQWRNFDYESMAREIARAQTGLEVLAVDRALPDADPTHWPAPPPTDLDPIRWLFYSSGTTAAPKGALHTDRAIMAAAVGMCRCLDLAPDDRVALVFPFTHIGGVLWLMNALLIGFSHIVIAAFDPKTSIDVLVRHGVTQAGAGTAFHQAYLSAQREAGTGALFPRVRSFPGGGAPKPPQLHYDIKRELGGAGIISGYGLTECPVTTMNAVGNPDEKLALTEGRANPPEMRIRVVKLDGNPAGPGEEGEIRAHGPQLCKGYLDESLNAAAFDDEGYFRTGDLGYLDEQGYIVITGRLKDVIIRKGENISAKEVEDLLYQHPKVKDVAVIGLPDPRTGERACAVVACSGGAPLAFEEMVSFLKDQGLMIQKIPEQLEILAEVPRNPTGKILKHELRKKYANS